MPGCRPCAEGETPCYKQKGSSDPNADDEETKKKLKGVKSRELRAGVLYTGCDCIRRNGLQDDCPRSQCQGGMACLTPGGPTCSPGLLALQRVRDAPNASIKRDPDHFKVRCDDKPGANANAKTSPGAHGNAGGSTDVVIVMAVGAPTSGSGSNCPGCGKKLDSKDKGKICDNCEHNSTKAVMQKSDGLSDGARTVYLCFPQTAKS